MVELDHTNRPVSDEESPDAVIKVWQITPHFSDDYDAFLVRGWQAMLDALREIAEHRLENMGGDDDELKEGLTFKVQLVEMTRQEYHESYEN